MNNNLGTVVLVKDINPGSGDSDLYSSPSGFTEFNDQLYFRATDGTLGSELYVSDGTESGTKLVKDINPGGDFSGSSFPNDFIEFNGQLYFNANDDTSGSELWVTDGTESGTELVADINPGSGGLGFNNLTEFNGQLYFAGSDGTSGSELWVTDGTESGTKLVKDINPGESFYNYLGLIPASSFPSGFTEFDGKLYFAALAFRSDRRSNDNRLYVTDGTAEGTELFSDIRLGSIVGLFPGGFTEFNGKLNGKLYFSAEGGALGSELYVTDGTESGTELVKDINPGSGNSFFRYITEFNGKLYFAADDGTSGEELYVTDGTESGTKLVADINPGSGSSSPSNLTVVGNELFFSADNGTLGRELFKLTFDSTVTQALNPIAEEASDDNLLGTDGDDGITGDEANNLIDGGAGNDAIDGGAGDDTIDGGAGTDTIVYQFAPTGVTVTLGEAEAEGTASDGSGGTDSLFNLENVIGSEFDDRITGNSGNNSLTGRDGDDVISGGAGDDFMTGGNGADILTGGEGGDRFVYLNPGEGGDTITDFAEGTDKIAVISAGFGGGFPMGELPESRFSLGSGATTTEQRFVFDDAGGELFYDADGSGASSPQLIATLGDVSSLSAGNIMVL